MTNKFAFVAVAAALLAIGDAAHAAPVPGSFVIADIVPPRPDPPPRPKPAGDVPAKPVPNKPGDAGPPKSGDATPQQPSGTRRYSPAPDGTPYRWIVIGAGFFAALLSIGLWRRRARSIRESRA